MVIGFRLIRLHDERIIQKMGTCAPTEGVNPYATEQPPKLAKRRDCVNARYTTRHIKANSPPPIPGRNCTEGVLPAEIGGIVERVTPGTN